MDNRDKSAKSNIKPDTPSLKAMESSAASVHKNSDNLAGTKSASSISNNLTQQLGGAEAGSSNFVFTPDVKSKLGLLKRFSGVVGRNKAKSGLVGGGFVAVIAAGIFGFAGLTTYALITIEKDIIKYEAKVEEYAEKKVSNSLTQHMLCKALAGNPSGGAAAGCNKKSGDDDEEDDESPKEEAAEEKEVADPKDAYGTDGSLAQEEDDFNFEAPLVKQELSDQGITVKTLNGKFDGLKDDSTGDTITTEDIANNTDGISDTLENAVPEWQTEQRADMEPLETELDHAGDSWEALPDEEENAQAVDESVVDDIINPPDKQQLLEAAEENKGAEESNKSVSSTVKQEEQTEAEDAADNSDMETAADNALEEGESATQATDAAADASLNLGSALTISTVASDICSIKDSASEASSDRVPKIMQLAMRHASALFSIADELKVHLFSSQVGSVMDELQGSGPARIADPTKSNPKQTETNEASLPWDRSAAWLRISGDTAGINTNPLSSSYTPDLDPSSMPTASAATNVESNLNGAVDDVGGGITCAVEESVIGTIGNFFANAVDLISGGLDFGASEAATFAFVGGVQYFLKHEVIPQIIKYFTPVGMSGTEDATQFLNITDEGSNLTYNDYSRQLGAEPVTDSQANNQYAIANETEQQEEDSQSFGYRTFALSNPSSLISQLLLKLPFSRMAAFSDVASYFTSFPSEFGSLLSTIFSPKILANSTSPSTDETPGIAYGITQYGFSNVTEYDPIQNEAYLTTTKICVTYVNNQGETQTVCGTLMNMLGDPLDYRNGTEDPNMSDVLHCFTEGFAPLTPGGASTASETTDNAICGSLGNYDYDGPIPGDSNSNPNPGGLAPEDIGPSNVAVSFCDYLGNPPGCNSQVVPQVIADNVMDRFRQYIIDVHVMAGFDCLTTNEEC